MCVLFHVSWPHFGQIPTSRADPLDAAIVCLPVELATFVSQEHLFVHLYQLIIYRHKYYKPICFGNLEIT